MYFAELNVPPNHVYLFKPQRGGRAVVMRRTPQKWYNMQYIDVSGKLPMCCAANPPRVRYSAAYPTRAERMLRRETKITVAIYCGNQV